MTQTSNTSDLRNGPDDNGLFGCVRWPLRG